MLKLLRHKKTQKRILIVLAFLIIPAFVLWGVFDGITKRHVQGSKYVGVIGDRKVTIDEFLSAKKGAQIQLILNYLGQKDILDRLLGDRALMNKLAWDRLIMQQAAASEGIKISDKDVVDFVTKSNLFLQNGVFDEKFYKFIIHQTLGISERSFEEHLRNSLAISRLNDRVLKGISVSDEEALDAYKKDNEKGVLSYLYVYDADFESAVNVPETEVREYYAAHPEEFTVPEKVSFEYMKFPFENSTERAYVANVVMGIYAKLSGGKASFEELAAENGRAVEKTGEFFLSDPPLGLNFGKATYAKIFGMRAGETGIFEDESVSGFIYIIKILGKIPPVLKKENEVASLIDQKIRSRKAAEAAQAKAEEIYQAISGQGMPLEDAGRQLGGKLLKSEPISRFDYMDEVGVAYDILDNVFKSSPGTVSAPVATRKGFVIVRLDEFRAIDPAAFGKEKEEYRNKVLAAKKNKALKDWFTAIAANAHLMVDLKYI